MSEHRDELLPEDHEVSASNAGADNASSPEPARKRPRTARQTASADELDLRICFTATLLSQLKPKCQIMAMLKQRYGCSARTCETYITRAREKLLEWTGKSKEQVRFDVVGLPFGALSSSNKIGEKIAIVDRIIAIFGLEAPRGLEIGNQDSTPFKVFMGFDPQQELGTPEPPP
jgi:hypothetical protein